MCVPGVETLFIEHARESNDGVQFIDGAIGLDARRVFWHTFAANQAGFALVAGTCIDFSDSNHALIKSLRWESKNVECYFFLLIRQLLLSTIFTYTTLFR